MATRDGAVEEVDGWGCEQLNKSDWAHVAPVLVPLVSVAGVDSIWRMHTHFGGGGGGGGDGDGGRRGRMDGEAAGVRRYGVVRDGVYGTDTIDDCRQTRGEVEGEREEVASQVRPAGLSF